MTSNKRSKAVVVPLAEVRRLLAESDELRQVANDAQDNADSAHKRARVARLKADRADKTRKSVRF
jgi:hypothetical protein